MTPLTRLTKAKELGFVFRVEGSNLTYDAPNNSAARRMEQDLLREDGAALVAAFRATAEVPTAFDEEATANRHPWVRLADVAPEEVHWLWQARIPLGKLTILEGDPDEGKSTVAFDIAARVSTGALMPFDSTPRQAAGVVILSAEDGLGDTIRPRLQAAGANLERVFAFPMDALPTIPEGLPKIEEAITATSAALLILDPLMAFLGGRVDSHRDQDVRRALAPLAALADRTGAATVVIRHLNKGTGGQAKHRGGGSIGIIGAARSALLVARDPADETRRVLARVKSNLCAPPPALAFSLVQRGAVARVEWHTETTHTADALLAQPGAQERGAVDEAADVIRHLLAEGPVKAETMESERRRADVSEYAWRQARTRLGIRPHRKGFGAGGVWMWMLPVAGDSNRITTYGARELNTAEIPVPIPIDDDPLIDDVACKSRPDITYDGNTGSQEIEGACRYCGEPTQNGTVDGWECAPGRGCGQG